jgi:MoxR-like ATPase
VAYVSKTGLKWALNELKAWANAEPTRRGQSNFFRLLLLKEQGITTGPAPRPLSTTDFRDVTKRFLQVSFEEDGSAGRTNATPLYFNLFDFDYKKARGASDFAVGTLWTRCQTWRDGQILNFSESSGPRRIEFTSTYINSISDELGGKKVPLLASALFLFRRPSDSQVSTSTVNSAGDLLAFAKVHFRLNPTELAALFDESIPPSVSGFFQDAELSRLEVLDTVLPIAKLTVVVGAAVAQVTATNTPNWAVDSNAIISSIDLVGLERCVEQALAALRGRLHVVFLGAPGTGKTTIAEAIAKAVTGPNQYIVATATADWTTYETMGGYLPTLGSSGSTLEYSPGIVVDAVRQKKWLILDELNRADIDKAFGELFTLLSGQTVQLPYLHKVGGERVVLSPNSSSSHPPNVIELDQNWRLIGTMNTFDKASLFQLSYAFMRRFAFIEVPIPKASQYKQIIEAAFAEMRDDYSVSAGSAWDSYLESLEKFFTTVFAQPDGGLTAINANVGPAIPRTMLRYAIERCGSYTSTPTLSDDDLFVEAASACLFPQYEGRRNDHTLIVETLASALPAARRKEHESGISTSLATWTGHKD